MRHCESQNPVLLRINGKISSCSFIDCGLLQFSGLLGNRYLSPFNCYLHPPEFCAGWHFPPLTPWQTQGSVQRCSAPAWHPSERPRNARGERRLAGSGVTNTGSPDVQYLGTAMLAQPWDLLTHQAKCPSGWRGGLQGRLFSLMTDRS